MSKPNTIFDILLPLPLGTSFEYRCHCTALRPGQLVTAPFGPPFSQRHITGLVLQKAQGIVPPHKLKDISEAIDLPPLPESFCRFLQWSAQYTMSPPGMMLKMALAGTEPPEIPAGEMIWQRTPLSADKIKPTSKAGRLLALFQTDTQQIDANDLTHAGLQRADALALVKKNLLNAVTIAPPQPPAPDPDFSPPKLTEAQQDAVNALNDGFQNPKPVLLQGVTGSGKTEVYCEAIATNLRAGKQSLVLMPEIALTTAMLSRFTARFGVTPTLWHSNLSAKQRRSNWWAIARGHAKLIIGARSALFLPYPALGLIVIDEEHEAAYKQEEGTLYNARDMAVARAHFDKIPIILASATPSIESHVNVLQGRYQLLKLPERFGGAKMPTIHRIDMRAENLPATRFLSAPLLTALRETIAAGEQAMLFLNRRGYAPLTLCRSCGHRLQCPQCSAWLVHHKHRKQLQCHHCSYHAPMPPTCPACRAEDKFAPCGPGVERVAEEVIARLPEARCAVMSSDLLDNPQKIADLLERITRHDIDLLIGTQIMAKGYHFPNMTLVGIVDADLGLSGGDPRASERCYQLLQQVAGRTGRAEKPGRAYLQTFQPEHPVMKALANNDHAAFMTAELAERAAYDLPPYRRLAALIISSTDARIAEQFATEIAQHIPRHEKLRLLGPAPAPLALLRGQHRMRLLIVADKSLNLQVILHKSLSALKQPKTIKLQIDIDPYSFF